MTEAYPLYWPDWWPRTPRARRRKSRFEPKRLGVEANSIRDELRLLGTRLPVISSNIALRRDGLPYSNQRQPDDTGIAVYFMRGETPQCIPCDRWLTVEENARAVWKSIKALRELDRWGAKSFVDAAFQGFIALPSPGTPRRPWWEVLGISSNASPGVIEAVYRKLARERHPDMGGSESAMSELNRARDEARQAQAA